MRVNHVASHWPVMMQLSQRPQKIRLDSMELGTPVPGTPRYEHLYLSLLMRGIAVLPLFGTRPKSSAPQRFCLLSEELLPCRGGDRHASSWTQLGSRAATISACIPHRW